MKSTEMQIVQDGDSRVISMSFGDISGGGGEEVLGIVRIYRSQDSKELIGATIEFRDCGAAKLKEDVVRYFEEHVTPDQPVDAFDLFKRFGGNAGLAEKMLRELSEKGRISGMETTGDKEATEGDGGAS